MICINQEMLLALKEAQEILNSYGLRSKDLWEFMRLVGDKLPAAEIQDVVETIKAIERHQNEKQTQEGKGK